MRIHNGIYANEKKGSRSWRGAVLMKDSISLANYQRLLQRLKPGTIFDLGTAGGQSKGVIFFHGGLHGRVTLW